MDITVLEKNDAKKVALISVKIKKNSKEDTLIIINDINKHQPFMLSMLMGYQLDLNADQFDGVTQMIFVMWEYFKDKKNAKKVQISLEQYERHQAKQIQFFKYLEGVTKQKNIKDTTALDLGHLKSKALYAYMVGSFIGSEFAVNTALKGILLIGMRSLIDCFEEIG